MTASARDGIYIQVVADAVTIYDGVYYFDRVEEFAARLGEVPRELLASLAEDRIRELVHRTKTP